MKTSFVKEGEKARIGIFTLDTKLSQYDSADLSPFKNIKLLINKDNTFEIKGYCAFLSATKGEWHYIDDGDINYTEYRFYNQEYSTQMQDASGIDLWILESCFAGKSRNHNKLVFVR